MSFTLQDLPSDRTLVMGILNVTPDSFADGGRYESTESAIARGLAMMREGADIIDVGGESTRPGSERISEDIERDRVLPVITALARHGARLSIDTTRASVAQAALAAGAVIVNDVSAGIADAEILDTVAKHGVPYVAMHTRGNPKEMNSLATYGDVVQEVLQELGARVAEALRAGILRENLIVDPGLGFAKEAEHNWELLRHISRIGELGLPVLVGASRKRFLGALINEPDPDGRESATIALTTLLAREKVWAVRVHNVKAHRDAIGVAEMMR